MALIHKIRSRRPPSMRPAVLCLIAVFWLFLGGLATPQAAEEASQRFPVEAWLAQGPKRDFPWKIKVDKPALTFQQRYEVWINVKISASALQKHQISRDLHFFVKAADETGRWLNGESYAHFGLDKRLEKSDILFGTALYLRPGSYRIGTIAYDKTSGERNVAFDDIQVKAPAGGPFSTLLKGTPIVEFLPPAREPVTPLGEGHAFLPISTKRPVEIDWLVDLSPYLGLQSISRPIVFRAPRSPLSVEQRPSAPVPTDSMELPPPKKARAAGGSVKTQQAQLLQTASLLTDLSPQPGCSRVIVLNTLDRHVVMAAEPSTAADWQRTWNEVLGTELSIISIDQLQGTSQAARFFVDQLRRVVGESSACPSPSGEPLRIVAIVARGALFPRGNVLPAVHVNCDCKVFYFAQRAYPPPLVDQLQSILKPLSPTRLEFSTPQELRSRLRQFIRKVETISADK